MNRQQKRTYFVAGILLGLLLLTIIVASTLQHRQPGTKPSSSTTTAQPVVTNDDTDDDTSQTDTISGSLNRFSYQTLDQLFKAEELTNGSDTTNQLYSPVSLYFALAMTANGADGETSQELLDLLGVSDQTTLRKKCKNLYQYLYQDEKNYQLQPANSVWLSNHYPMSPTYATEISKYFYGDTYQVDFTDPKTRGKINQWVSDKTHGLISKQVPETSGQNADTSSQQAALINTLYLKEAWDTPFSKKKTIQDNFYSIGKDTTQPDHMDFLVGSRFGNVFQNDDYTQAGCWLYDGDCISFILPEADETVQSLLQKYSTKDLFGKNQDDFSSALVNWQIPKMDIQTQDSLLDMVASLGVNKAFSKEADFSKMIDKSTEEKDQIINGLYVSEILQNTKLTLDEQGVEAAAVTEVQMKATGAIPNLKVEMKLNRPFLFAIQNYEGNVLFAGIYQVANDSSAQ